MSTKRSWILLLTLAVVVVLANAWIFWPIGRAFDAMAWNDAQQVNDGVRLEMADWLVAKGTLAGKTRTEVVALLGDPPNSRYFRDWDLVYWLGNERGYGVDSEWLVIRLDINQRVTQTRIVTD